MQMRWTDAAELERITPLTHPEQVMTFIEEHPGLLETCEMCPRLVAEYAPQITIAGFEGSLLDSIEEAYTLSCEESAVTAQRSPEFNSHNAVDEKPYLCSEEWSVRHPTFGNYEPEYVAHAYFCGGIFGPTVSPYEHADHLFWLLSSDSQWLPERIRSKLLEGLKASPLWLWTARTGQRLNNSEDSLFNECHDALEQKRPFIWTDSVISDVTARIEMAIATLGLHDSYRRILEAFVSHDLPSQFIETERRLESNRNIRTATKKRAKTR